MEHSHLKIVSLRTFISQLHCTLHLIDRDTEEKSKGFLLACNKIEVHFLSSCGITEYMCCY